MHSNYDSHTLLHDVMTILSEGERKREIDFAHQIMNVKDEKQTTRAPANLTVPRGFNFSTERRLAKAAGVSSVPKVHFL
jgi:hypothetical protein